VLEVSSHFILLLIILLYHFACFDFQIENNNFVFSQTKHCYKHKEPSEETHMEIIVHKTLTGIMGI